MVTDEELAAHVSRVERESLTDGPPEADIERRIEAIDRATRSIHDEFARHGAVVERYDENGDRSLADRLADVERRLAEVERALRTESTVTDADDRR